MAETSFPQQPQEKNPVDEIKELERLLEQKKQALAESEQPHDEKEVFRQVFNEKFSGETASSSSSSATLPASLQQPADDQKKQDDDDVKKKQREEQLKSLIDLSFEKGVMEAVNLARAMSPWLLDELHDRLVNEYYDKLLQSRK